MRKDHNCCKDVKREKSRWCLAFPNPSIAASTTWKHLSAEFLHFTSNILWINKTCFARYAQVCGQSTHTKVWLRQRWGQVTITQHVRWREANVKVHTVSKAGEGVRRPRKNNALERKNGKVNNTSGFSLCSCHSAHSFHKLLCQTCGRCNGASHNTKSCSDEQLFFWGFKGVQTCCGSILKSSGVSRFLDGLRITLPDQWASLDEKKAGAAAQV